MVLEKTESMSQRCHTGSTGCFEGNLLSGSVSNCAITTEVSPVPDVTLSVMWHALLGSKLVTLAETSVDCAEVSIP